jgi:flagellar protein FliL
MMRFLIPLVLLLLGVGSGVGAGLFLALPSSETAEAANGDHAAEAEGEADAEHAAPGHADAEGQEESQAEAGEEPTEGTEHGAEDDKDDLPANAAEGHEYVRLNNQFVVPLLTDGEVDSLVLLSIAVEVPAGEQEAALSVEPKLRDVFLQVLFDHANAGGFDGLFTAGSAMRDLRSALLAAAQDEVGELVTDVLILDLARQAQ